jgi:DnaA-homolog protein
MKQLLLDLSRPPLPTLDNYATGSNGEALAALHAWPAGEMQERCIYLWGPAGSGKTHLLRAVAQAYGGHETGAYAHADAVIALEQAAALPQLIAVDDVGQLSPGAQGALFRLFQRLPERGARLLAAGDAAPAQLKLREDVRSRLAAGLVFQLRLLSDAEKAQALRSHAAARGFVLAPELTGYLLRHGRRDLCSLMAVLDALDQYSLQTKRPITLPLLREVLQLAHAAG